MNLCYRSNIEFMRREAQGGRLSRVVGTAEAPGIFVQLGPIVREEYVGDVEPVVERDAPLRPISWQRHLRTDIPRGWRRALSPGSIHRHGWVDLRDIGSLYEKTWNTHARRHLQKWKKEQEQDWEIVEPTMGEFVKAMRGSDKSRVLTMLLLDGLRYAVRGHGRLLHVRAARRRGGPLEVGLATLDVPECNLSVHHTAFTCKSARASSAGIGLIAEWFERALTNGFEALHMGVLWAPSSPKEWKGFSRFKSQFGTQPLELPPSLVRWEGSLLRHFSSRRHL